MDFRSQIAGEVPPLRRFARALTGDPALADDLVQDCIERALKKQHLFDETRSLRTWLFTILRNLYVSGLRRNAQRSPAKSVDEIVSGEDAVKPEQVKKIVDELKQDHDYVIIDTAGRLHIDEELMDELKQVKEITKPDEILLVVDAMTGQDAVNVAESFNEQLDITGVVLTKLDGDTRGGAALSPVSGHPGNE
jgi:RNA polymerase sigma factor (sigma-70 family)